MKARSPGAVASHGAFLDDQLGGKAISEIKPHPSSTQSCIIARIVGSDRCSALGMTGRGSAPVLSLCRELVAAGHDPATPLEVWRRNTLALTIRSIGEGAKIEASPRGVGFVHRPDVRGTSHIPQNHPDVDAP